MDFISIIMSAGKTSVDVALYTQVYSGYGESLIDYNVNAFKERLEVSGTVTIADRMAAARRRVKEQAGGEE